MDNNFNIRELYNARLLVFVEVEPQSNIYHQVLLDSDELLDVSDAIAKGKILEIRGDLEIVDIRESEEEYKLPDLKQVHEKKRS